MAVTMTLKLNRKVLKNVDDDAGRWQYEGGQALVGRRIVANYASTKRVTFGATDNQNTAMLTITLFFKGKKPPENITLMGAHDFNSGNQIGSVSASSEKYSEYIDGQFKFTSRGKTLKITSQ